MSRLRESAHQIARRANEARGEYKAQGWHYRLYRWWLAQTKRPETKDNFCHYWRVIAIWAPLLWLKQSLRRFFSRKSTWIVVTPVIVALLVWLGVTYDDVAGALIALCSVLYVLLSVFVGIFAGGLAVDWRAGMDEDDDAVPWWVWLLLVVCAPASILGAVIGLIACMVGAQRGRRFARWFVHARLVRGYISPRLATVVLVYAGCVVAMTGWGMPIQFVLWLVAIPVAIAVIVPLGRMAVIRLGERLERRRDERRREATRQDDAIALRRLDPLVHMLYGMLCDPTADNTDPAYIAFRDKLIDDTNVRIDDDVRYYDDLLDVYRALAFTLKGVLLTRDHEALYRQARKWRDAERQQRAEQRRIDEQPVVTRRMRAARRLRPLRIVAVGIGDTVILIAQFMRAQKLKICPIVTFPDASPHKSTHS